MTDHNKELVNSAAKAALIDNNGVPVDRVFVGIPERVAHEFDARYHGVQAVISLSRELFGFKMNMKGEEERISAETILAEAEKFAAYYRGAFEE